MAKPQQPELRRSGLGATDESAAKIHRQGEDELTNQGNVAPVPENTHPDTTQKKTRTSPKSRPFESPESARRQRGTSSARPARRTRGPETSDDFAADQSHVSDWQVAIRSHLVRREQSPFVFRNRSATGEGFLG